MKIQILLWMHLIFLLPTNAFSQDLEELRLYAEANKTRFISPEKSLKLYDYLLKNTESKSFAVEIEIRKLQINRFLGEYRIAIRNSYNIKSQLHSLNNPELYFLYFIENAKLFQDLELSENAMSELLKAKNNFKDLPAETARKNLTNLVLAENYIHSDTPPDTKIDDLKSIIRELDNQDERLPWLFYRLSRLYKSVDIDSAKVYAARIPTENDLDILGCIFRSDLCRGKILSKDFNQIELPPDLKIAVLEHNLEFWQATKNQDSILEIREKLQSLENLLDIEKKQAKVDLLQNIYEAKKQEIYAKNGIIEKRWLFGSLSLLVCIAAYFGILFYRKFGKDQSKEIEETTHKPIVISDKTEMQILENLEEFERSKLFLDKQMRIASLAKHLDTNTRYLSTIINAEKDKTFNNYINSLRINYILEKLDSDPKYLTYKISYLAEESGFASQSSFTAAFKDFTGKTPSTYIRDLENR